MGVTHEQKVARRHLANTNVFRRHYQSFGSSSLYAYYSIAFSLTYCNTKLMDNIFCIYNIVLRVYLINTRICGIYCHKGTYIAGSQVDYHQMMTWNNLLSLPAINDLSCFVSRVSLSNPMYLGHKQHGVMQSRCVVSLPSYIVIVNVTTPCLPFVQAGCASVTFGYLPVVKATSD